MVLEEVVGHCLLGVRHSPAFLGSGARTHPLDTGMSEGSSVFIINAYDNLIRGHHPSSYVYNTSPVTSDWDVLHAAQSLAVAANRKSGIF